MDESTRLNPPLRAVVPRESPTEVSEWVGCKPQRMVGSRNYKTLGLAGAMQLGSSSHIFLFSPSLYHFSLINLHPS
jgi:hypothetical protein